mmetsp:Transcript_115888/g.374113  ORF Transcript_115888/g.374113 Transcript_115888/m.374113 type:complete len:215 (-) Transcript_115888:28-672(-)
MCKESPSRETILALYACRARASCDFSTQASPLLARRGCPRPRNRSHAERRRERDEHCRRRARRPSCPRRRQDVGRVALHSGVEQRLEGLRRGGPQQLHQKSLLPFLLLDSGVGLVPSQARVAHPASSLFYFYQRAKLVPPVVTGAAVPRLVHHVLHVLQSALLLSLLERLLHVRVLHFEQGLIGPPRPQAVEEAPKAQEICAVQHQTFVAEEEF